MSPMGTLTLINSFPDKGVLLRGLKCLFEFLGFFGELNPDLATAIWCNSTIESNPELAVQWRKFATNCGSLGLVLINAQSDQKSQSALVSPGKRIDEPVVRLLFWGGLFDFEVSF